MKETYSNYKHSCATYELFYPYQMQNLALYMLLKVFHSKCKVARIIWIHKHTSQFILSLIFFSTFNNKLLVKENILRAVLRQFATEATYDMP